MRTKRHHAPRSLHSTPLDAQDAQGRDELFSVRICAPKFVDIAAPSQMPLLAS
eukprot:COSAG01_NODE_51648_length_353_cov_0.700787_1_plen_52_part_01